MSKFTAMKMAELTDSEYETISEFVKRKCGINLHQGKKELIRARLNKRIRSLGMTGFNEYMNYVVRNPSGAELTTMLDSLSTNLTYFYREPEHFKFLKNTAMAEMLGRNQEDRKVRIWSAGCSTGEEPYSIGILLLENISNISRWDVAVLASDLSTQVLAKAQKGSYDKERVKGIHQNILMKYFAVNNPGRNGSKVFQVKNNVRKLITFARLNLMEPWPMRGPFDLIFCRNVMIYFDKPTQETLINRYFELLADGGYLFVGHSESLAGTSHRFKYVKPAIYQKA